MNSSSIQKFWNKLYCKQGTSWVSRASSRTGTWNFGAKYRVIIEFSGQIIFYLFVFGLKRLEAVQVDRYQKDSFYIYKYYQLTQNLTIFFWDLCPWYIAHPFGRVEFRIFVMIFFQLRLPKENNNKYLKFEIRNLTRPNWCKAMKSSPLLGAFCGSEFWGFSLLKI